jgi:hypothetical protein
MLLLLLLLHYHDAADRRVSHVAVGYIDHRVP